MRDDRADDDGADDGQDDDRRVLAPDEGDRALVDRAGDVLHRLGARVARQDVAGEVDGEQHGDESRRQDDQLERARIHQGLCGPPRLGCGASGAGRGRGAVAGGCPGIEPGGPVGMHRMGWDLAGRRECIARQIGGSNRSAGDRVMQSVPRTRTGLTRDRPSGGRPARPYTAGLVTRRPALGCLFEIVETLVLTLIIFLRHPDVRRPAVQGPAAVDGATLEPDQYVLVDKLTPRFDTYKRGDIVVFNPPPSWGQDDGTPFIKRVIGVGGDTVEIHDGHVFVNDVELDEPYVFQEDGEPQPTTTRSTRSAGSSRTASCS